jgi:hypothetical protein
MSPQAEILIAALAIVAVLLYFAFILWEAAHKRSTGFEGDTSWDEQPSVRKRL